MDDTLDIIGQQLGAFVGWILVASLVLGVLWVLAIAWIIRRATVGRDPEALAAVRALPLGLALGLDAIDLGLDFFGAPLAWMAVTEASKRLNKPELKRLRGLTVLESLIPGTQLIPVMTITWLYAQNQISLMEHEAGGVPIDGSVLDGQGRVVDRQRPILETDANGPIGPIAGSADRETDRETDVVEDA